MLDPEQIFAKLPYGKSFLFAESINAVDDKGIEGRCFFSADHPACQGHFKDHRVLPGVIVVEGMGQIALVAHALYLTGGNTELLPVVHQIETSFYQKIPVAQSLKVKGVLIYFRNNIIKSNMFLYGDHDELLVRATALAKLLKPEQL